MVVVIVFRLEKYFGLGFDNTISGSGSHRMGLVWWLAESVIGRGGAAGSSGVGVAAVSQGGEVFLTSWRSEVWAVNSGREENRCMLGGLLGAHK